MPMRGIADELAASKYSHVERERRWLVESASRPRIEDLPYVLIEDSYIRGTRCRLRRMTCSDSGERVWKLTKKYDVADPLARPIVTAYLSEGEHAAFTALAADQLSKRRYDIDVDGVTWSLDRFEGSLDGLELAEIEMPADAQLRALLAPAWAGTEVTLDGLYEGGSLAANGRPREI